MVPATVVALCHAAGLSTAPGKRKVAMPTPVPIENVRTSRFLRVSGGLKTEKINAEGQRETFPVAMEVYTGVVVPDFSNTGLNISILQDEIRSFVPFEFMRVKAYPHDSIIDFTAMASPATIAGSEDEAVIVGVDNVPPNSVLLESQPFGECLVMRASLAALNATIFRYTYQVTLLVKEGAQIQDLAPLNTGTTPA